MVNTNILAPYVPSDSIPLLEKWFEQRPFELKISKRRITKLGDYRPPHGSLPHRISVNANLNPYAFLITLTHEFAHLLTWNNHQNKVKAHGKEWKEEFRKLMQVLLHKQIFPEPLDAILWKHMENPPASSSADATLVKALKQFDKSVDEAFVFLSDVPQGHEFSLKNKGVFVKGEKRRTRFLCQHIQTKKQYVVHGNMEVIYVADQR